MKDLDHVWRALADPSRRSLLDLLRNGPKRTGDLSEHFRSNRFAVMKHLRVLEKAGLVTVRPEGRERWNYLNPIPIQMIYERWMTPYAAMWAEDLLDLKRTVESREDKGRTKRDADRRDARTRL